MKKHSAFSLLELSIVLLIIGILVAGVTQGRSLIKQSILVKAQSLTNSSPVKKIDDLVLWYETSSKESFIKTETEIDGSSISTWIDINPRAINRNNANQSNPSSQPKIYFNVFKKAIPALRFDGNDFMNFDGSQIVGLGYTIFIVEQRMANISENYFIGGGNNSVNGNLHVGYRTNTSITQDQYANGIDYNGIPPYSSPIPRIHTFFLNTSSGKKYWLNGGDTPDASNSGQTTPLNSYDNSTIGRYLNQFFSGDLAEIIIFKRALQTKERKEVEDYLSKKYDIKLS